MAYRFWVEMGKLGYNASFRSALHILARSLGHMMHVLTYLAHFTVQLNWIIMGMLLILVSVTPIVVYLVRYHMFFIHKLHILTYLSFCITITTEAELFQKRLPQLQGVWPQWPQPYLRTWAQPPLSLNQGLVNEACQQFSNIWATKGRLSALGGFLLCLFWRGRGCGPKCTTVREVTRVYAEFQQCIYQCSGKNSVVSLSLKRDSGGPKTELGWFRQLDFVCSIRQLQ